MEIEDTHIEELRKGNRIVFKTVYDLYWSKLYISAFNLLQDREQAEDVVQEVFGHLWSHAARLEIVSLRAWLFTAVRYQVFNVIRSGKVRRRFENLAIIEEFSFNIAELKMDADDIKMRVVRALDELPPKCREIMLLNKMEYKSYREIAAMLDISEKTVENQLAIGMKKLRIALKDLSFLIPFLFLDL
ncbi:RNA polymerase sigma-70 factor [Sphingobacterium griseoflavum]|uniref:DNA-directed RNA polymerase sigma-70 factor n=1 Tax=Sphingobacterium griseoflavum TaxID=1474952 RepID=A0ABQ3HXZ5_9SPHI|nr:RNA polymerase sigma-70 factor [Sphingobacterium griseoflavum]GHE45874.1 DNA-directed RNA polymerase sigma-70 factor [Sphingobacterium griseoflavum]